MPSFYFLKVGLRPGGPIVGESQNVDFRGWIELETYAPLPPNPENNSGGGPGKSRVREFGFTKRPDSTSAPMFMASHAGQHFDGAILAVEGPGTPIWFQFSDVLITSYRQGLPVNSFNIGFVGIQWITRPASAAGLFGPPGMRSAKMALSAAALAVAASLAPSSAPVVAGALRRHGM